MKKVAAWLVLVGLSGCLSQTLINSSPPGAEVLVDGRPVGVTPATFTENSTWNWSQHLVTLRRPGYATLSAPIAASRVDVGRLIVGALLVWPVLLAATSYPATYDFPLTPLPRSTDPRAIEAPPEVQSPATP